MSRRKILFAAALCAVVIGVLAWLLVPGTPDPVRNGKRLSEWLESYEDIPMTLSVPRPVPAHGKLSGPDSAVRLAGTNAIPLLLKYMSTHDDPVRLRLMALAKAQHLVKVSFVPAERRNMQAARAFAALGPQGVSAVPELVRIYNHQPAQQVKVLEALAGIGPTATEAIPAIIGATTNASLRARLVALTILAEMHVQADVLVPALIRCLGDSNILIKDIAVRELGNLGPAAKSAIPELLELRQGMPTPTPEELAEWRFSPLLSVSIDNALNKINPPQRR